MINDKYKTRDTKCQRVNARTNIKLITKGETPSELHQNLVVKERTQSENEFFTR